MDDQRPVRAQHGGDLGDPRRDLRVADADQGAAGTRGVRERPEQVEGRPDADLTARRAGVAHRRVKPGREQECEAELAEVAGRRLGVVVDPDPERVENVGRTGARGDRPVAVLRDRDARGGHDQRRRRRDVERARAVAARADDIDRSLGRLDPQHPLAHGRGEARQLLDRLAAHP